MVQSIALCLAGTGYCCKCYPCHVQPMSCSPHTTLHKHEVQAHLHRSESGPFQDNFHLHHIGSPFAFAEVNTPSSSRVVASLPGTCPQLHPANFHPSIAFQPGGLPCYPTSSSTGACTNLAGSPFLLLAFGSAMAIASSPVRI